MSSEIAVPIPRVLMVVPQYPYPVVGGLERQAHELAKALVELGVSVRVLSGRTNAAQAPEESVEGVPVSRIPWSSRKAIRFLRGPIDVVSVLFRRRNQYDIVHVHQLSWFSLLVIVAARLMGKSVLAKVPGVDRYGMPGLAASFLGPVKVAIVRRSDAVVAMSKQGLGELIAAGVPEDRVLLTPNGIRVSTEEGGAQSMSAERHVCRVVFVGRISAEKALDTLLSAWRHVVGATNREVRLELWGRGPLEDQLATQCRALSLNGSVRFIGHVDDVREKLSAADIFVLPSLTEGNSNAVLEAMAAGLPVVSTRVGGTPMQVGPEGAPFLVEPGDEEGLRHCLMKLIENEELRRRIGAAMRLRIEHYFDIRKIAATYAAAYRLLGTGAADQIRGLASAVIESSHGRAPDLRAAAG